MTFYCSIWQRCFGGFLRCRLGVRSDLNAGGAGGQIYGFIMDLLALGRLSIWSVGLFGYMGSRFRGFLGLFG